MSEKIEQVHKHYFRLRLYYLDGTSKVHYIPRHADSAERLAADLNPVKQPVMRRSPILRWATWLFSL